MRYLLTGVKGGEFGSSVDNAAAPVSPLSSAPRPLDFLGRGMPFRSMSVKQNLPN